MTLYFAVLLGAIRDRVEARTKTAGVPLLLNAEICRQVLPGRPFPVAPHVESRCCELMIGNRSWNYPPSGPRPTPGAHRLGWDKPALFCPSAVGGAKQHHRHGRGSWIPSSCILLPSPGLQAPACEVPLGGGQRSTCESVQNVF